MCTEFQITGSLEGLKELRDALDRLGRSWNLSKQEAFELHLVLDELCSNYIEHAGETASSKIKIELSQNPSCFIITISDSGPPFDPTLIPPPDLELSLEDRKCGGLGLHFVRHFTDQVAYSRENNENCVKIIKKRKDIQQR